MLNKFWNGKFYGLPYAFWLILVRLFSIISNKTTTVLSTLNLAECGRNVQIYSGFFCRQPSKIFIGNNVIITNHVSFSTELPNEGKLIIEDGVSIGNNCRLDFTGGLTLCKNVHLAHFVSISTHDHGYNYKNKPVGKPLRIEENVFVGSNAHILHNVNNIGKNAVIGTGAIVTKDVPENAIVAGNPARIIGYFNGNNKYDAIPMEIMRK